jgi:hypothetical protein
LVRLLISLAWPPAEPLLEGALGAAAKLFIIANISESTSQPS